MSRLIRIFLRPERRADVIEVEQAQVVKGSGLEGDHCKKGKRQVTILSLEGWMDVCDEMGCLIDVEHRRANLLVEGIDLRESLGKRLRIGEVELLIQGETTPCRLMDEAQPGLKQALTPDWRGGVFAEVTKEGEIHVEDLVEFF